MTRAHPREGTLRFDAAGRVAAGRGGGGRELQQRMQMRAAAGRCIAVGGCNRRWTLRGYRAGKLDGTRADWECKLGREASCVIRRASSRVNRSWRLRDDARGYRWFRFSGKVAIFPDDAPVERPLPGAWSIRGWRNFDIGDRRLRSRVIR